MPRDFFQLRMSTPRMIADTDEAEAMLYGEIVPDYGKWYKENYPENKSAADFDKEIKDIKRAGAKKLRLRINSPGGVVHQAVAMRAILTNAGFDEIRILIEGMCASAATILASIPGARVSISPGSEYMIHNPWSWAIGNAEDMEREAEHLRSLEATTRGFYTARTGQTDEQVKEWMDAETWFNADDAVDYGFADEVSEETAQAAACVSSEAMALMKSLYKTVPEAVKEEISNGTPVAGGPTEINNHEEEKNVDIKDINMDQLRAENPALLDEIRNEAIAAERQRQDDIDAMTVPGYEAMAAEAKAGGTSAMDFHKQMVKAMKEKGTDFLSARQRETAPAAGVAGGTPSDDKANEQNEIEAAAREIAGYAAAFSGSKNEGMF